MRMTGSPKSFDPSSTLAGTAGRASLASQSLSGSVAQGGAVVWAGVPGLFLNSLHGVGAV